MVLQLIFTLAIQYFKVLVIRKSPVEYHIAACNATALIS